jgi:protein-tyrosine phosphatase
MTFEIAPRVFFGPAGATHRAEFMTTITHVVNCDSSYSSTSFGGQAKHFLFLKSYDEETYPILDEHLEPLCKYIDRALQNPDARVYIHCYMGINRSAALAIGYACNRLRRPARIVIDEARKATNRLLLTNQGFEEQLKHRFPLYPNI